MSLKEIFGQDKAVDILQRAHAADKSPHAYIFAGPDGVGKFKTAREWAKMLLCKRQKTEGRGQKAEDRGQRTEDRKQKTEGRSQKTEDVLVDNCGECESCKLFEAGSHPDFHHIYKELLKFTREGKKDAAPVEMPIDVIREFLIDKVSTRPTLSVRKVFVVSEAEKLNNESQNCLLKVLEEPPPYCSIILLCTRMENLLPTTKSRCRVIRFSPIHEDKIIEHVKQMNLAHEAAQYFSRLAQGSLGAACQYARLELAGAELLQTKKQLLDMLSSLEYPDALDSAEWLIDRAKTIAAVWAELEKNTSKTDINRQAAKTIVSIIISALHDTITLNLKLPQNLINSGQKDLIKKLAESLDPDLAAQKITLCYQSLRWIEAAVNEKLIFEHLLLNLAPCDIIKS
jgi:DNA polymerase-3 subunit delta'